jgi:hypothetical protein
VTWRFSVEAKGLEPSNLLTGLRRLNFESPVQEVAVKAFLPYKL